jgi:beta-lactamase class A
VRPARRSILLGAAALPLLASSAHADTDAQRALRDLERSSGGRIGVAVLDTRSVRRILWRADEHFLMASTSKLLLVAAVLTRVDRRRETLTRMVAYTNADILEYAPITSMYVADGAMSVSDLCEAAISYSDNTAANLLLGIVGGPEAVTAYARSIGDDVTRFDRTEPSLNVVDGAKDTTSPNAMMENLRTLLLGSALSPLSRALLNRWMDGSVTGKDLLKAGLPPGWTIGDKTGRGGNGATNDIGIIHPAGYGPILIAAYTIDGKGEADDHALVVQNIARIVATEFHI